MGRTNEEFYDYLSNSYFKMKNGLGRNVNSGLKPLAQYMEALRAGATSRIYSTFMN